MRFSQSIKKEYVFKRVLKKGKYASFQLIAVHILPTFNEDKKNNYLGICVSKKHGNSVVRNKLKRWARAAYYELEPNLKRGNNIIIVYKKNIKDRIDKKEINFFQVRDEMKQAFIQLQCEVSHEKNI